MERPWRNLQASFVISLINAFSLLLSGFIFLTLHSNVVYVKARSVKSSRDL